jgi:hypothetical protein
MPQKCTVLYIILLTRILAMNIWTIGSLIILHPVLIFFLRVIRRGVAGVTVLTAGRGES